MSTCLLLYIYPTAAQPPLPLFVIDTSPMSAFIKIGLVNCFAPPLSPLLTSLHTNMPVFSAPLTEQESLILAALESALSCDNIPTILRHCKSGTLFHLGLKDKSIWPLVTSYMKNLSFKVPCKKLETPCAYTSILLVAC